MHRFLFLVTLLTFHSPLPTLGAAEPAEPSFLASIERVKPMDTTGLDAGLARVLQNYYQRSFTSLENWQRLESLRFDGTLHLPQGDIRFTAYKKRPNLCKIEIEARSGRVVLAYDGSDAWQLYPLQANAQPTDMPEGDALNFIRDATASGHLLYPLIAGKTIQLLGVADVEGQRAYHLRTRLPNGQEIQSFLDMTTFLEIRQITTNNTTGDEEVITHGDFRTVEGIQVPFVSTLTIDGQEIHQSRIERAQFNQGVMPWMFRRPSGSEWTLPAPVVLSDLLIAPASSTELPSTSDFFLQVQSFSEPTLTPNTTLPTIVSPSSSFEAPVLPSRE